MESSSARSTGFFGAVRTLGDGLLAGLQGRIALFSVELQEEKYRLIQILFWIGAAVFSGVMAIAFASLALVYVFWASARLAVLAGLGVFYAAVFVAVVVGFRRYLARQPRPFAATLNELDEDRACIRNAS